MENLPNYITSKTLANLLEIDKRQLERLTEKGVLLKAARNTYELVTSVQAYIKYIQGPEGEDGESLKERLLRAQIAEREAKACQAECTANLLKGTLIKRVEVERQWAARLVEVKAALLELPRRVAFLFTDPEIQVSVEEEARHLVEEMLEKYSRGGIMPEAAMDSESAMSGTKAAETVKRKRVGGRKQNT